MICVADEEVGGTGAEWLCAEHPELVRCDYLLNEGDGAATELDGDRRYAVALGDKGVFRFTLTTDGVAGHASMPAIADNALLKLAPLLDADRRAAAALGRDGGPARPVRRPRARCRRRPRSRPRRAAGARTRARAARGADAARDAGADDGRAAGSEYNVIPARARTVRRLPDPPGMEEATVLERVREVLGADGYRLEFTGGRSRQRVAAGVAADGCVDAAGCSGPSRAPLPADDLHRLSDSRTFRAAFPEIVAYGFFPHRHMPAATVVALVHGRDERIDVRDLALATDCYRSVALELLGWATPRRR